MVQKRRPNSSAFTGPAFGMVLCSRSFFPEWPRAREAYCRSSLASTPFVAHVSACLYGLYRLTARSTLSGFGDPSVACRRPARSLSSGSNLYGRQCSICVQLGFSQHGLDATALRLSALPLACGSSATIQQDMCWRFGRVPNMLKYEGWMFSQRPLLSPTCQSFHVFDSLDH